MKELLKHQRLENNELRTENENEIYQRTSSEPTKPNGPLAISIVCEELVVQEAGHGAEAPLEFPICRCHELR